MYELKVDCIEREGKNHFVFYIQIEAETLEEAKRKVEFILLNICDPVRIEEA